MQLKGKKYCLCFLPPRKIFVARDYLSNYLGRKVGYNTITLQKPYLHVEENMICCWISGGGGQMVIVLTFYSDNACSNPAERTVLVLQNCLKRAEIKKKEDGDGPFLEKLI